MFNIALSPTYKWPIDVFVPDEKGNVKKQTFTAVFKRLTTSEVDELQKKSATEEAKAEGVIAANQKFCLEILVGFEDLMDGDQPLDSNPFNIDRLLEVPTVAEAIILAFTESFQSAAKRKN